MCHLKRALSHLSPRRYCDRVQYFSINMMLRKLFCKRTKYDCVFSIGASCPSTDFLRSINLRRSSAPLDWVYGLDFAERIEVFINEFPNYLNKDDLEIIGRSRKRLDVKNNRTGFSFPHDFRVDTDFDTEYKIVLDRYNRRIQRLLNTIKKSKRVLAVYMENYDTPHVSASNMSKILGRANKKYVNKIDLLYIKTDHNLKPWQTTKISHHDRISTFSYAGTKKYSANENKIEEKIMRTALWKRLSYIKVTE